MGMTMAVEDEWRISTRSKSEVREAFERWARWDEAERYHGGGWSSGAGGLLGSLCDGRGSTVCPTCKGQRRMPGHLVGSSYEFLNVPCPGCAGDGKVAGDLAAAKRAREITCVFCLDEKTGTATGELPSGSTCPKCKGGKILKVDLKVHPATIKGTRYLGPDGGPGPTVELVDRTMRRWANGDLTKWMELVVRAEYTHNGTQDMKVTRMGISRSWYTRNLRLAHQLMGELLCAKNY